MEINELVTSIGGVFNTDQQVATIVMVRRREGHGALTMIVNLNKFKRSLVHHLAISLGNKCRNGGFVHFLDINVNGRNRGVRKIVISRVPFQGLDVSSIHGSEISSWDNMLSPREVIEITYESWHVIQIGRSVAVPFIDGQLLCSHKAGKGKQEHHHQRKYFLFHNELIW